MFIKNRFLFRFIVSFFTLLIIPFPVSYIPFLGFINTWFSNMYQAFIPWFAKNILHLDKEITVFENGSGDTTYNYVLLLVIVIVSFLITIIWTVLDKKKHNLIRLNYWFITLLRYFLGYNMMSYGWQKVIPMQFSEPGFFRLLQPLGEMSPMGLAWTFIGFSPEYTIFSGVMEVTGGILVLYYRTRYLGALILTGVMANVMALNYFYDVPVKLFSTELWLMAIIIVSPKIKQLIHTLLDLKPTTPQLSFIPFLKSKRKKLSVIGTWIVMLFIVIYPLIETMRYIDEYGPNAPKPPLYGLYEVTSFKANGKEIVPTLKDTVAWRYVDIEWKDHTLFYRTDMSRFGYSTQIDTLTQKITWASYKDTTKVYTMKYTRTDSTMRFQGIHKNDTIDCMTKILTKDDFRLTSRGYNWIQEYPFNR
ncbi:hypothetical protein [uncultured Dokdonia sp.]|uniref:DoxX family protein n=1 Tax=uncultured Dokdonia sp. TaxID=575653 RepID=UPI002616BB11|nr:hypothetical protein [uncultured Dokdonia sp.]